MPRGGRRPGAGRKPGVPNKDTREIRSAFELLVKGELDELRDALHEIRFGIEIEKQVPSPDGEGTVTVVGRLNADPKGYVDALAKLAKFCVPELARAEMTGADGGPVRVIKVDMDD